MRRASLPLVIGLVAASFACAACGRGDAGATVEALGTLPRVEGVQGRDGGCSALVWGQSVWTFGDTVLTEADADGTNWHHNSFSVTDDMVGSDGIQTLAGKAYFIAPTDDEAKFNADHLGETCAVEPCGARFAVWPGPPIWDEARSRAIVFYGLIHAEPGDFNFEGVGQSIAVWGDPTLLPERPILAPGTEHPTMMWAEGEPGWGAGAAIEGDELYAFECADACALAKAPLGEVLDRAAWRYWDGEGWSKSMSDRASLFAGAPTLNIQFNDHLGAWTAIYAEPLSNDVVMRTAPELEGPWTDAELLFVADKPDGAAYDTNVHREYQEEGGKVMYVTFSRSNGEGWFGTDFELVKVTLP